MDTMSISLAGMSAATVGAATAADNLANASGRDARARRADSGEAAGAGARTSEERESGEPGLPGDSGIDPAEEGVDLLAYSDTYMANAKALEVQKEVLGTVMDLKV